MLSVCSIAIVFMCVLVCVCRILIKITYLLSKLESGKCREICGLRYDRVNTKFSKWQHSTTPTMSIFRRVNQHPVEMQRRYSVTLRLQAYTHRLAADKKMQIEKVAVGEKIHQQSRSSSCS